MDSEFTGPSSKNLSLITSIPDDDHYVTAHSDSDHLSVTTEHRSRNTIDPVQAAKALLRLRDHTVEAYDSYESDTLMQIKTSLEEVQVAQSDLEKRFQTYVEESNRMRSREEYREKEHRINLRQEFDYSFNALKEDLGALRNQCTEVAESSRLGDQNVSECMKRVATFESYWKHCNAQWIQKFDDLERGCAKTDETPTLNELRLVADRLVQLSQRTQRTQRRLGHQVRFLQVEELSRKSSLHILRYRWRLWSFEARRAQKHRKLSSLQDRTMQHLRIERWTTWKRWHTFSAEFRLKRVLRSENLLLRTEKRQIGNFFLRWRNAAQTCNGELSSGRSHHTGFRGLARILASNAAERLMRWRFTTWSLSAHLTKGERLQTRRRLQGLSFLYTRSTLRLSTSYWGKWERFVASRGYRRRQIKFAGRLAEHSRHLLLRRFYASWNRLSSMRLLFEYFNRSNREHFRAMTAKYEEAAEAIACVSDSMRQVWCRCGVLERVVAAVEDRSQWQSHALSQIQCSGLPFSSSSPRSPVSHNRETRARSMERLSEDKCQDICYRRVGQEAFADSAVLHEAANPDTQWRRPSPVSRGWNQSSIKDEADARRSEEPWCKPIECLQTSNPEFYTMQRVQQANGSCGYQPTAMPHENTSTPKQQTKQDTLCSVNHSDFSLFYQPRSNQNVTQHQISKGEINDSRAFEYLNEVYRKNIGRYSGNENDTPCVQKSRTGFSSSFITSSEEPRCPPAAPSPGVLPSSQFVAGYRFHM